jgi:hypothetical protein
MQTLGLPKDAAHCYPLPNDWVQLLELLNKVWDLVNLIEARFSSGYAKTVALSCFQRGDRARGLTWLASVVLHDSCCLDQLNMPY